MSESNAVRIEIAIRLDFLALAQMHPAQSRAILDGITAVIASGKEHAESHYQADTDPELCDNDDCPHWPLWWVRLGQQEEP